MTGGHRDIHDPAEGARAAGALARPDGGGPPRDLQPPSDDPWGRIEVPPGWQPVAAIARQVAADLDQLADHIVTCVAAEIEPYQHGHVPLADLRASVKRNLEMILLGLAERRGPSENEIAVRSELGMRRALQGMPVDAVIQAFHVGYRELWLSLVRVVADDPAAATQLLTAATTVWEWVHGVTDALAAAHASTVRTLEARAAGARQRFIELLAAGDLDGSEADQLTRSLGFVRLGPFAATVIQGSGDDADALGLQRRLDGLPGHHAVATRGPLVIVVSQDGDVTEVVDVARHLLPWATITVGGTRPGLHGARESLQDAELTLAVAPRGQTATFEERWLWATLTGAQGRLGDLLEPGARVGAAHPHLAEAVRGFAEAGFAVSAAARSLDLHANTVTYRLDRWHKLTGWDPRTFDGLVRSLASLRLSLD